MALDHIAHSSLNFTEDEKLQNLAPIFATVFNGPHCYCTIYI